MAQLRRGGCLSWSNLDVLALAKTFERHLRTPQSISLPQHFHVREPMRIGNRWFISTLKRLLWATIDRLACCPHQLPFLAPCCQMYVWTRWTVHLVHGSWSNPSTGRTGVDRWTWSIHSEAWTRAMTVTQGMARRTASDQHL